MKTLSEYVSWLNSMTTTELLKEFPGEFHLLDAGESPAGCVTKILANDAILWRKVKEYNQKFLKTSSPNSISNSLHLRSDKIELLDRFITFLQKNGYLDTDATCEEPFAIDEFLKNDV